MAANNGAAKSRHLSCLQTVVVSAAASNPTTTEITLTGAAGAVTTNDEILCVIAADTSGAKTVFTARTATVTSAGKITVSDAVASETMLVLYNCVGV